MSREGHFLCRNTGPEYKHLRDDVLQDRFGFAHYYTADDYISRQTCGEVFMPIMEPQSAPELGVDINLMRIHDGDWYDDLHFGESLPYREICEEAWENHDTLMVGLADAIKDLRHFFFDKESLDHQGLRIFVGPESLISMFVAAHDDPDMFGHDQVQLGLFSGQSFVIFHTKDYFLDIQRFEPAASVQRNKQKPRLRAVGAP